MSFEEVLANCLHSLEQGRSLEDCLAQYPEHRAELAPILRMIDPMRQAPKPQLSARAFARGRAAVAAHARHQQKLREPFIAATPRAVQSRPFYAQAPIMPGVKAAQVKAPATPLPPRPFLQMHRLMRAFVVLLLIVTFASFVRGVASSLPGTLLYPLKGWGENAQGLLMVASGQQANWHVNQLERRLTEFALLTQQGAAINPILTTAIDSHLQAALDGSTGMSADERSQFLLAWLDRLHTLQQDLPGQTTTVATLKRTIATVETAAQRNNAPTILPAESTATPAPQFTPVATLPAGPVLLPTVTPTDTELPVPPVVLDTPPLAVPTPAATATPLAMFTPATPTATNTELVIAPTVTESPQLMPQEGNRAPEPVDAGEHESSKKATPTPTALPEATVTATPVATLPAPRIPLPTDVTTEEAGTPTTAEPTEPANQTRVPGGIPTSAEPPTPAPTDTARNTPTATEKAATSTPTRAENKTSTPEPTATEKAATPTPTRPEATATPKPEETTRETPAPNTDSPTPTEDETAEPAEELDEPTPEPTPTPKKKKK